MLYSHEDMDSLHILPLAVMPLQTRGLQSANLVKNSQFRSVVELFAGEQTGSGQIEIDDVGLQFEALKDPSHPDMTLLRRLGQLRSYDVYSLRITFREQRIPLKNQDALRLSSTKAAALADFMRSFTRSLMKETFAPTPLSEDDGIELAPVGLDDEDDDDTARSLSKLINPSDPDIVHTKLADLAKRLEIKLDELPSLLEDFADLHLSIAYYEDCYNKVTNDFDKLFTLLSQLIRSNGALQSDAELLQKYKRLVYDVTAAKRFVQEHLMVFENLEREFWNEVSASRLREIDDLAKANHLRLGGILCGMTVKTNSWRKKFPSPEQAAWYKVAEFFRSELGDGMENILNVA